MNYSQNNNNINFSKDYRDSLRNLVKEFIMEYNDENYNDNFKKANEFLLDYSFGNKMGKSKRIIDLEKEYQDNLYKIFSKITLQN